MDKSIADALGDSAIELRESDLETPRSVSSAPGETEDERPPTGLVRQRVSHVSFSNNMLFTCCFLFVVALLSVLLTVTCEFILRGVRIKHFFSFLPRISFVILYNIIHLGFRFMFVICSVLFFLVNKNFKVMKLQMSLNISQNG